METYPLVRKIYLYLFSLVGLTLMIIAGVQLINLALRVYVFTQIDRQDTYYQKMPPCSVIAPEKLTAINQETSAVQLTAEEKASLASWQASYKAWQKEQESYDPITASRQRTAAQCLAMLVVGLPLFAYHWQVIRKEAKA
ncbi:MAG: hypothetical protein AAB724_01080 [Patescibacteria group bacterium]